MIDARSSPIPRESFMHRLISICIVLVVLSQLHAENWPEFRGPTGQGHYAKALPTEWSTRKNVVWKQTIPGKGWSSPIVQDGRIYLTTAMPIAGSKDQSLQALCLDAAKG